MSGIGFPWIVTSTPTQTTSSLTFVNDGVPLTVAALHIAFPPSATVKGKYANVTDLYGSVDDVMRCRYDGTQYRWVPQRESMTGTSAAAGGTVNIIPLVTPPTLRLTATALTGNLSVVASTVNAYNGQRSRIIMPSSMSLGLYVAQITGLLGSNISLLSGKTTDIEFNGTSWFQSS